MFRKVTHFLCCLLLLTISTASVVKEIEFDDRESFERELAAAGCNQTLGDVKAEDVKRVGRIFLDALVTNPERSTAIFFKTAVHDFRVYKLCSSCHFINIFYYQELGGELFPYDWLSYCSNTTYGYRKFQSFLVFMPLDRATGEIMSGVKLRAYISLPETRTDLASAPTEAWPRNLSATLEDVESGRLPPSVFRESEFGQFVTSMLGASSGSVSILPDYVGFGRSELNRTFMWPEGYKQSTFVAWLHVREFFHRYAPCTQLDMEAVTLQGYEDGVLGGVHVAQGFRRFKTRVLKLFSGTGIFDLDTMIKSAIETIGTGGKLRGRVTDMLRLATFSLSSGHPNLANTGKGQDMVSEFYRTILMDSFIYKPPAAVPAQGNLATKDGVDVRVANAANETVFDPTLVRGGPFQFINPDLLDYYIESIQGGEEAPCRVDLTDTTWFSKVGFLCKAIADASAYPTLRDETQNNWIHELELCYSPDDPVVPAEQAGSIADAPFTEVYDGPFGETGDILKPLGNKHSRVKNICGISAGLFWVLQNHRPDEVRNYPNYTAPLDYEVAQACGVTYDDGSSNNPPSTDDGTPTDPGQVDPGASPTTSNAEPDGVTEAPSTASVDTSTDPDTSASSVTAVSFFMGAMGILATLLL